MTIEEKLRTLAGHSSSVNSASFSPDGKHIVTASGDGTTRLWDTATGRQIGLLGGQTAVFETVAFSPDGERIVTLRRVGKVSAVGAVYHIPAAAHPDNAAMEVLGT